MLKISKKSVGNLIIVILFFSIIFITFCEDNSNNLIKVQSINKNLYGFMNITPKVKPSILEIVKKRGKLIAGIYFDTPFSYISEGEIIGFEIDILKFIANELKVDIEFKEVTNDDKFELLINNKIDLLSSIDRNIERDTVVDFSIHYFVDGQRIIVKNIQGISKFSELKGKKIAVLKDSNEEANLKNVFKSSIIHQIDEINDGFRLLLNNKVDGFSTYARTIINYLNQIPNPKDFLIIDGFLSYRYYAFALLENDSDWRDFINYSLIKYYKIGEYEKSYNKYFGKDSDYCFYPEQKKELWK